MIKGSVGAGGRNVKADVKWVQEALNQYIVETGIWVYVFLDEDGKCGSKTIQRIKDFQAAVVGLAYPDGRVDVRGKTDAKLREFNSTTPVPKSSTTPTNVKVLVPAPSFGQKAKPVVKQSPASPNTDPRQLKTRTAIAEAYGAITAEKKWTRQADFLKPYTLPVNLTQHKDFRWTNTYDPKKRKVSKFWCNIAMHAFLNKALANVVSRNLVSELTEFGGSHAIRATRGTLNWSAHSWALAIDINMKGNELGKVPVMSKELVACFTDAGFGWGGKYKRQDGMHFTLAGFDMPRA